jgi:hypothetical protein
MTEEQPDKILKLIVIKEVEAGRYYRREDGKLFFISWEDINADNKRIQEMNDRLNSPEHALWRKNLDEGILKATAINELHEKFKKMTALEKENFIESLKRDR